MPVSVSPCFFSPHHSTAEKKRGAEAGDRLEQKDGDEYVREKKERE
jgi:hypothetical protein